MKRLVILDAGTLTFKAGRGFLGRTFHHEGPHSRDAVS
jgi:hypothetical protein